MGEEGEGEDEVRAGAGLLGEGGEEGDDVGGSAGG